VILIDLMWLLQAEEKAEGGGVPAKQVLEQLGFHLSPWDIAILLILQAIFALVLTLVLKPWIEERIKHRFAKEMAEYTLKMQQELERYKREMARRDQAAKVAELLSLVWSGDRTTVTVTKINQLSWEMSLWLPPELAKSLATVLATKNAKAEKLLLDIRRTLLDLKVNDITENDIIKF
jgi:hypothetical protein